MLAFSATVWPGDNFTKPKSNLTDLNVQVTSQMPAHGYALSIAILCG